MSGEVGLALRAPEGAVQPAGRGAAGELLLVLGREQEPVARAEEPCVYKYPKKKHFNALLSDMMNELTKIFMRASEVLRGVGRRARIPNARFRVVSSLRSPYFDGVYANMTVQYKYIVLFYALTMVENGTELVRKFYEKAVAKGSQRSDREPCQQQPALRRLWADVLAASLATLRAAALRCVRLQLEAAGRTGDSKLKNRLGQFLLKEFGRFRAHQLDVLCHEYSLCYKDLLRDNETQQFDG